MELVLVIEAEVHARRLVRDTLEQAGYRVLTADGADSGLLMLQRESPDMLVVDLDLPGRSSLDLIRCARLGPRHRPLPILLLAPRPAAPGRLPVEEWGVDDYLTGPLEPGVLVRSVRLLLQRMVDHVIRPLRLAYGDLVLDQAARRMQVRGESVPLTPAEFELVRLFMEKPGHIYSRQELADQVLSGHPQGSDRCLDTHIRNLRCKIELDPHRPDYIQTVHRIGYRMNLPQTGAS